jgi:hypothetical protein
MNDDAMNDDALDRSEYRKVKLCREWVYYCQSIGWSGDAIPHLVDLFWKYKGWRSFKGWRP